MKSEIRKKQKVLIADDSEMNRSILTDMLGEDFEIIEAVDGKQAVTMLQKHNLEFSILLLDIVMPEMDGFNLCNQIRDRVDCPIIFLTAKTQESEIVQGLGLGADDYITKPFGTDELRARVNAHLRRDVREKKNSFSISGVIFRLNAKEAEINSKKVPLTKSEYEICEYLARHHGQTFTREQIYEAVFGFDGESDSSVISTHIKNIRGKLAEFHLSTIETIWGVGYKWV